MNHPYSCFSQLRNLVLMLFAIPTISSAQSDHSDKISTWKTQFPKEETIAYLHKEVISFSLNATPAPGEGKVKANVSTHVTLVPLKDFIKYDDGLFYNQEITIDNIKAVNSKGKEVAVQKQCGPYNDEDIFHSDARLCVVRFTLEEKGKPFSYNYQENYRDVKYLTSFYLSNSLPAVEKIVEFQVPSWLDVDLREFNFAGAQVEKTSVKENDLTKTTFRIKNVPAYKREPSSPNHALSYPHIVCVTKAYTENGQRRPLFESVKDLYAWYHSLCDSIGNQPEQLKEKVASIINGKKRTLKKLKQYFIGCRIISGI